jgi:hypothetical protein
VQALPQKVRGPSAADDARADDGDMLNLRGMKSWH